MLALPPITPYARTMCSYGVRPKSVVISLPRYYLLSSNRDNLRSARHPFHYQQRHTTAQIRRIGHANSKGLHPYQLYHIATNAKQTDNDNSGNHELRLRSVLIAYVRFVQQFCPIHTNRITSLIMFTIGVLGLSISSNCFFTAPDLFRHQRSLAAL